MDDLAIERHQGSECPEIENLWSVAADEGHPFVDRTRTEWIAVVNRFERLGECFFLAYADDAVVGMCGVNIDPYLDDRSVGRLRHLYVHPDYRRRGVALALVNACRDVASEYFERIRLRTANPRADVFYRAIGFETVSEDQATHSWPVADFG